MHLSPIKGGFPHKDQHDRTAPVAIDNAEKYKLIERGSVIRINNESGEFELAEDASQFPMYLALQKWNDLQATMAGLYTAGNADPEHKAHPWPRRASKGRPNKTQPAITGIHMDDGDVWETDMYDEESLTDTVPYNTKLTVKDGLITVADTEKETPDPVIGFLVKAPYTRYINNAVVVEGMMTGRSATVIQFQCGK